MDASVTHSITLNGRSVDFAAQMVRDAAGAEIPLRAQSFAVLRHLVETAGRTVSKDELIATVWGGVSVTDDSLVQCVRDVRRALGDEAQKVVRTVPRRGYRLDLPETGPARSMRTDLFRIAAGIALICLVALVGWQVFRPQPARVAADVPVVAVLPFENMSADPALDYMGKGLADDLIAMLARTPDMAVVSALSSFPFGSAPVDLRQVGAELGAGYLLRGGVRREGDNLRITAQLVDAATGQHLWAERFDRAGADPLELQDEIAGLVVGALTGERGLIVRSEYRAASGKDTANLGEYDHYLRGHDFFLRFDGRDSNDRAADIWREGLANYPDSALLKVMLGWHHSLAGGLLWSDDPATDVAAAGRLVRSVLAEDDPSPRVRQYAQWLFARVLNQERKPTRALAEARRAVDLAPYDAFMLSALAQMLVEGGETDQSRQWLEQGARLAPGLTWLHNQTWGNLLRLEGDYAGSVSQYDQSGRLPFYHQLVRAISLVRLGRIDEAQAAVAKMREEAPALTRTMWRASTRLADVALLEAELADLAFAGLPE